MILSEANNTDVDGDVTVIDDHDTEAIAEDGGSGLTLGQLAILLYLGLVFLSAVALNLSILMVFIRKSSLRTTSNRYRYAFLFFIKEDTLVAPSFAELIRFNAAPDLGKKK
jgi:hypothetical protein